MPVHLNEVTRAYFTRLAGVVQAESPQQAAAMRAIVANPNDAAAAATLSADPRYNSQLRTSCVSTMLEGGHATNALPQRARANVNCRILPDETPEQVRAVLERVVGDTGVKITFQGTATDLTAIAAHAGAHERDRARDEGDVARRAGHSDDEHRRHGWHLLPQRRASRCTACPACSIPKRFRTG